MSRNISLFSGYSQKENRTTNYCLLILKMLYEENPKHLSEVLSSLFGEDVGDYVGVQFRQQEKKSSSVPDGLILQRPFTIYIETKNFDWFYDDQIERHLSALSEETTGLKILLLLSKFEADQEAKFAKVRELCSSQYQSSIRFASAGFDDLLSALKGRALPKNLADAVSEFGDYLDHEDLLPTWRSLLDVVNCAGTPHEILDGQVYLCPVAGGAYNHVRCRYFGMYRNKCVDTVAEIEAVVDVLSAAEAEVKWKNVEKQNAFLVEEARNRLERFRPGRIPHRVFVLGQLFSTNFRKDTSGGMVGSKQYFSVQAKNASELADALRDQTWTGWKQG